jgi:hypothetical protein
MVLPSRQDTEAMRFVCQTLAAHEAARIVIRLWEMVNIAAALTWVRVRVRSAAAANPELSHSL